MQSCIDIHIHLNLSKVIKKSEFKNLIHIQITHKIILLLLKLILIIYTYIITCIFFNWLKTRKKSYN